MPNRTTHQNQGDNNRTQGQQASRMSDEQPRDSEGRFIDDDDKSRSSRTAGSRQDGDDDQPRDAQGRFIDDDDNGQSRSSRAAGTGQNSSDDLPRDAQGRFIDDDQSSGSRASRGDNPEQSRDSKGRTN